MMEDTYVYGEAGQYEYLISIWAFAYVFALLKLTF